MANQPMTDIERQMRELTNSQQGLLGSLSNSCIGHGVAASPLSLGYAPQQPHPDSEQSKNEKLLLLEDM